MHIHQSIVDTKTGRNIFSNADGSPTEAFRHYIGGLQRYMPAAMAFFAPYVNSYRRLVRNSSAPINIRWGRDNRTVGHPHPALEPGGRRVENRVIGADANPYVATAVTLACGYLGMVQKIEPSEESGGNAYNSQRDCRAASRTPCETWKTRRTWPKCWDHASSRCTAW